MESTPGGKVDINMKGKDNVMSRKVLVLSGSLAMKEAYNMGKSV